MTFNAQDLVDFLGFDDVASLGTALNAASAAAPDGLAGCHEITMEENGNLAAGSAQWSVGNGSTGSTALSLPIGNGQPWRLAETALHSEVGEGAAAIAVVSRGGTVVATDAEPLYTAKHQADGPARAAVEDGPTVRPGTQIGYVTDTIDGSWTDARFTTRWVQDPVSLEPNEAVRP